MNRRSLVITVGLALCWVTTAGATDLVLVPREDVAVNGVWLATKCGGYGYQVTVPPPPNLPHRGWQVIDEPPYDCEFMRTVEDDPAYFYETRLSPAGPVVADAVLLRVAIGKTQAGPHAGNMKDKKSGCQLQGWVEIYYGEAFVDELHVVDLPIALMESRSGPILTGPEHIYTLALPAGEVDLSDVRLRFRSDDASFKRGKNRVFLVAWAQVEVTLATP